MTDHGRPRPSIADDAEYFASIRRRTNYVRGSNLREYPPTQTAAFSHRGPVALGACVVGVILVCFVLFALVPR